MEAIVLTVAFGAVFVLLGRWLYRNPRRLYPGWGILNRDHPKVQKVARIYATFFIFFGTYASAAVILVFLLPGVPGIPILGLAAAAGATWLLCPRTPQPAALVEPPVGGSTAKAEGQNLLSAHWKRNLAIGIGLMALLLGVVFIVVGESDISKMAFAAAQASPVVRQQIGEPVKRGFFTSGNIQISGPTGQADIAIPIKGPKGEATVYAVARKRGGLWKFETLQVSFNGDGARFNLLKDEAESGPR